MQGYAWLYLIAGPINYIIYAYMSIHGFSLFADEERLKAGKPVLGFLNPWLYAKAAGALTDIVKGNNKECLESDGTVAGFIATPGWDPVSGSISCLVRPA